MIKKSNGKKIETPNIKDVTRNFPGSGNLSDFHIKIPKIIGGNTVAKYKKAFEVNIFKNLFEAQFHN